MAKEKKEKKKEKLTKEELQLLINVVAQVSVPVGQSQRYIDLINKMSRMVDLTKKRK